MFLTAYWRHHCQLFRLPVCGNQQQVDLPITSEFRIAEGAHLDLIGGHVSADQGFTHGLNPALSEVPLVLVGDLRVG